MGLFCWGDIQRGGDRYSEIFCKKLKKKVRRLGTTKSQRKRKQTYEQLKGQLILLGCDQQFYIDQIDEYMIYYDNLQTLNEKLLDTTLETKEFNEILKEKRQVTKEMRNILAFLKLRPSGEDITPTGSDTDATL